MKQSLLRLFTCLILGIVFCSTAWAQTMGKQFEVSMSLTDWNNVLFPKSAVLADAKSLKIIVTKCCNVTLKNGSTTMIDRAWDNDKTDAVFNLSGTDLTVAKNGNLYIYVGGKSSDSQVLVTNYDTESGAANDTSGSTSGVFTGDKKGGYTVDELKAQYNPIDMEKVNLIISKKRQITHLPTVYITIPDAASATNQAQLNAIVFKDLSTREASYHTASIKVVDDNDESLSFEDDALEIKVRGNETAKGDKKPYRLKFGKDTTADDGTTISHKHDMLGYGYKKRNWTLIANEKDGSFCHNALSYHIGKAVGMEFCPGYRFVDLVINDIYLGCYMISDHIEVGSNRIELEDENTGWYVESNRDDQYEAPYLLPEQGSGIYISIKNPEYKETDPNYAAKVAALKNDINTYFTQAKTVIDKYSTDINLFRDHENGWRKYFDEESLVKYYVGENLTGNHDAFMTVKMYRDMGQKIKVGPMWDHDTAFGIYDDGETLCEDAQSSAPLFCGKYAKIIADNDPEFMQKANYLLQKVLADGFEENMKSHISDITSSVATSRTIEKPYGDPFQTEITKLENYITAHNAWLRETVNTKAGGKTIVFPETPVTPPATTRGQLTNLPTIYLDATTINGEWQQAAVEVFDSENKLYQGETWKKEGVSKKGNINVSVQYQGSGAAGSKNSYRLKFNDKINLLTADGLYKQWVLLANDDDPSMLNNALAKELGDAIGMPWTPGYQFVDLYVNNTYMGTYQVTDRIKAESGRALVTGGNKDLDWHVRLNDAGEYNEDKPTYYIAGTSSMPYIIPKNPDPKDDVTTWNNTLKDEMTTYFNNVFTTDASGKYTAFADNVDHQQLIEWYIAQEMLGVYKGFSSIEAYRSVAATDKNLHIGILWDSEKAFGNTGEAPAISMEDLNTAGSYAGLMTNYAAYDVMKNIFSQLWQERWFANGVNNLWKEKHEAMLAAMNSKVSALQTELATSWAKNATKWNITGEQATSIDAMKAWLTQRDAYLTEKFAALAAALPCETHTYENHNYIEQTNGTYLIGCDVCGTIKEGSETFYKFKVYPESKNTTDVFATSWHPSAEHPNSIAVVEADKSIVEQIEGYNIVCGKKPILSDGTKGDLTCKDFRLTDGHPYYSSNKFVATKATYSRIISNAWGTLVLPYKMQNAETEYANFYHLDEVKTTDGDASTLVFASVNPDIDGDCSAYVPVVFKATDKALQEGQIIVNGENITVKKSSTQTDISKQTVADWTLIGTIEQKIIEDVNTELAPNEDLYYISKNKFWHATGKYTNNPFRAYFIATSSAGAKSFNVKVSDEDQTTNINGISEKSLAIFVDKGGITLCSGKNTAVQVFTASGALVANTSVAANGSKTISLPAGLYIVNGTKVIVK